MILSWFKKCLKVVDLRKIENIHILVLMLLICISILIMTVGASNSANQTNQSGNNSTNITMNNSVNLNPEAVGILPSVSIQVTPQTFNFGSRIGDGLEQSYINSTQITLSASQWFSTGTLNLYISSNGDLNNGSSTIKLNNFKYDGFSNSALNKPALTISNVLVNSWDLQGAIYYSVSANVNGNYYLTVPLGTTPGIYGTNVYYTAMIN